MKQDKRFSPRNSSVDSPRKSSIYCIRHHESPSSLHHRQHQRSSRSSTLLYVITLTMAWISGFFMARHEHHFVDGGSKLLLHDMIPLELAIPSVLNGPSSDEHDNPQATMTMTTASYRPGVPMNVQQSQNSLHPKWKLWSEMTPLEQNAALNETTQYLNKYGRLITSKKGPQFKQTIKHGSCDLINVGREGNHQLCGPPLDGNCTYV